MNNSFLSPPSENVVQFPFQLWLGNYRKRRVGGIKLHDIQVSLVSTPTLFFLSLYGGVDYYFWLENETLEESSAFTTL